MRTAEDRTATTSIAIMATVTAANMTFPPSRGTVASGRFDNEDEAVAIDNFDAGTGLQWFGGASAPDLSPNPNPPILSLPSHGLALSAKQCLLAGDDESFARPE